MELNQQTELRCLPPAGVPPPRVYWLRNGVPLDTATDASTGKLFNNNFIYHFNVFFKLSTQYYFYLCASWCEIIFITIFFFRFSSSFLWQREDDIFLNILYRKSDNNRFVR